jgi:hypothetical protein
MDPVIAVGLGAVLVGVVAVVAFRLSHRSQARIREIKEIYGPEVIRGTSESYCAYLDPDMAWECGGSRGLVYAEATISPNANAYRPYATGTASALLDYAEEKARVGAS